MKWLIRICQQANLGLTLLAGVTLIGCEARILGALDEGEANQAITRLQKRGVLARKEPDTSAEGRFRLSVGRQDADRAVAVLQAEGLPRQHSPGVLEALGEASILPSRSSEQAKWLAGTAGELERSLSDVEGIVSARVHLAVPAVDPLAPPEGPLPRPTASVLISYRGTPGLTDGQVQRLVSGAVSGLAPEAVAVVAQKLPQATEQVELQRLGPFTVTRASAPILKALLGAAFSLNLLLLGGTFWFWYRSRKLLAAPQGTAPASALPTQA